MKLITLVLYAAVGVLLLCAVLWSVGVGIIISELVDRHHRVVRHYPIVVAFAPTSSPEAALWR